MLNERIKQQFDFEVAGAKAIMAASAVDRPGVYAQIYDEFYSEFGQEPHGAKEALSTRAQIAFIRHFLRSKEITFVEFGPGICSLLLQMAQQVSQVIGIEASAVATAVENAPSNLRIIVAPRGKWQLDDGSVDIVYSNQVLEHLHPEDCLIVLKESFRVLRPGGRLLALTPSRITGPHDISKDVPEHPTYPLAVGLHLIEYDSKSLARMVREAGFKRIGVFVGSNAKGILMPVGVGTLLDRLLSWAPRSIQTGRIGRGLAGIRMAAIKPA